MEQIRFIKDCGKYGKVGEIKNAPKKSAESFVSQGYAEYVNSETNISEKIKDSSPTPEQDTKKGIIIPERLRGFNFVLLGKIDKDTGEYNCKAPYEMSWQKLERRFDNPLLQKHLAENKNYGIRGGSSSAIEINGKIYSLVILDFDDKEAQDVVEKQLPETFTTKTGGKGLYHLYLACDDDKSFKVLGEKDKTGKRVTLIDVQGEGKQVVAPGSINDKTNKVYEVVKDIPIAFVHYEELLAILKPLDLSEKNKKPKPIKQFVPKNTDSDLADRILNAISIEDAFREVGIEPNGERFDCPVHASTSNRCVKINSDGTAKCFGCGKSWNAYSLLREVKNWSDKVTWDFFAEKAGLTEELEKSRKQYRKTQKINSNMSETIEAGEIFGKLGQARAFFEKQPGHYSSEGLWLFWNKERFCFEMKDEVDLLNGIRKALPMQADTVDSKERGEILWALKQIGRENKPKPKPKGWLQFQDILINPKTGERKKATSEYLLMSPIPHRLGNSEDTPEITRLFKEWVVKEGIQDESYIKSLEEASAYALTDDLFMQRLFPLTGGGCNGKGTYLEFMKRLVGKENCVSVDLKKLSNNDFAMSAIYKKLLAITGELSHDDLKNTNAIKKLTGEDMIDFEFKGKTSFSDENVTTFFLPGNSLPTTPDKSVGFYRRNQIIDFPNTFEIKNNILGAITEKEYENFCLKCVNTLKKLYETNKFTNEGNYEEREKKYEERSNPLPTFIEENCIDEPGANIKLQEFSSRFNCWLKSKRLRPLTVRQIGGILRNNGFEVGKRKNGEESFVAVINLSFNPITTETTETTKGSSQSLIRKSTAYIGSSGSSGSSVSSLNEEKDEFSEDFSQKW